MTNNNSDLSSLLPETMDALRKKLEVKKEEVILNIYAIYDIKSEQYDTPFFAVSDLYAKRRFLIMSDEEKSPLYKWPEDFELHKVATFGLNMGFTTSDIKLIFKGKEKQ